MAIRLLFIRKHTKESLVTISHIPFCVCSFSSKVLEIVDEEDKASKHPNTNNNTNPPPPHHQTRFGSLLQSSRASSDAYNIELVDHDSWQVSSGLTQAWKQMKGKSSIVEPIHGIENASPHADDEPEFDEIEEMRFRGKLFYKLDRDSREFDECNLDFHKKRSSQKHKEEPREKKDKKEKPKLNSVSRDKESSKPLRAVKNKTLPKEMDDSCDDKNLRTRGFNQHTAMEDSCDDKKLRTPTFNQLTAPYHEPFCLDIFISKSSVRACIIHRVTSKVVVVAHSISKDMKFDLKSTKDENACVAVGEILAQRALADDIHDIVYTPRKGDKVEGKLEIVLQSLMDHGLNVKVKLKQRKPKKSLQPLL